MRADLRSPAGRCADARAVVGRRGRPTRWHGYSPLVIPVLDALAELGFEAFLASPGHGRIPPRVVFGAPADLGNLLRRRLCRAYEDGEIALSTRWEIFEDPNDTLVRIYWPDLTTFKLETLLDPLDPSLDRSVFERTREDLAPLAEFFRYALDDLYGWHDWFIRLRERRGHST